MIAKQYCVYILASKKNGTLYTGITSNLTKRIYQHKNNLIEGFTRKYSIHKLVYYEVLKNVNAAILKEKHIKKWNRQWKIDLIEKKNPQWNDLYEDLFQ